MIIEIQGDLFKAPEEFSLAHCVSQDLRMSAGIATEFKNKYGELKEMKNIQISIGGSIALKLNNNTYIYYLITKRNSWDIPTYSALQLSLSTTKNHMINNNIRKLAIPRIGCGLDQLSWTTVKQIINDTFNLTNSEKEYFQIRIYTLPN